MPFQAPSWPAAAPPRPAVSQLWPACSPRSAQPACQQAAGGAPSAGSSLASGWLWQGGPESSLGAAPLAAPCAGAWTWTVPSANQPATRAAAPAATCSGDQLWQAPAKHAAWARGRGDKDSVLWSSGAAQAPPQDPGLADQAQVGAWDDRALSHSQAGPGPSSTRQACTGAADQNPGEGQCPAEGSGFSAHPASRGWAPGAWPECTAQQHARKQAALPAALQPAGSEQGAAMQAGRQNPPVHGACWPSRSVGARSGAISAGARSAKEAAAPEASGASDGHGAAVTSGGAGGCCAGWRGQAGPAGAQRPVNPGTGFCKTAQPPAHVAGHGRAAVGACGRRRAHEAAGLGLALQAVQQRAREFAEHVFARGPPPAAHPCPGVYKAGGHGCGAPLRFAPICLAPGKVVERWRCARAGDGCGYAEFPAPRVRWPQLALEAASPDAFQVAPFDLAALQLCTACVLTLRVHQKGVGCRKAQMQGVSGAIVAVT